MTLIILLFLIGVILLAVEVIVPGGILGVAGAILMVVGCALAFKDYGTSGGLIAIAAAVALAGIAVFIEFYILPKTTIGKRAFLSTQITGSSSAFGDDAKSLVGKPAEAVTMLSPTGYVRINGKRYEAFCQSGQVPAGSPLKVVGTDNFRIIVSLTNTN
ncbi:MAG: NfeD family protein [Verrucomicrobiales bacterium]|nr:NfeD family protein [Verrucomicrobiota bacterium JB025]